MHRSCERAKSLRFAAAPVIMRLGRLLLLAVVLVPCTAARLVDVRSARHEDFTRIVFETDEKVSYAIENRSLGSERAIELSLPASTGEMIVRAVHEPALSVQVEATDTGSRALVRVMGPVDVWTNQLGNPPRVVLDLRVAEPVGARDPEQLDALDYQIVVEADPDAPRQRAQEPSAPPLPVEAPSDPPDPSPSARPTGWAGSTQLWWALAAVAVAFLVVLWLQRVSQRRRREERVSPPPPAPQRPSAAPKPPVSQAPRAEKEPSVIPTEPEATPPEPEAIVVAESPRSAPARTALEEPTAPDPRSDRGRDPAPQLFELLSRMEERLAVLERELRETRAESRDLRERSSAHAEELRAHRVAVAGLLRRPGRARTTGASRPASDSSSGRDN